ncbi:MAG: hypothetical protein WDN03_02765 [Rhizomicrobium sp.]
MTLISPAHALDDIVVAGLVLVRSGVSESGQRAIDQGRIFLAQTVVIEAVFRQRAGLEVLHHDMRPPRQPPDQRLALWPGHVDRDGLLVAVGGQEIGRVAAAAVRIGQEGRTEEAGLVALAGLLDLDHLGAQVAENLGRPGRRQDAAQIEHADM